MNQQTISVSAADLNTVLRDVQVENTNLRLVLASARRQLVETQAALAAAKKVEDKATAPDGEKEKASDPITRSKG